jgi:hypothetical protein
LRAALRKSATDRRERRDQQNCIRQLQRACRVATAAAGHRKIASFSPLETPVTIVPPCLSSAVSNYTRPQTNGPSNERTHCPTDAAHFAPGIGA